MADTTDAYAEYVESRRTRVEPEVEVTPHYTEREAKLVIECLGLIAKELGTPEQVKIMKTAADKTALALKHALNGSN